MYQQIIIIITYKYCNIIFLYSEGAGKEGRVEIGLLRWHLKKQPAPVNRVSPLLECDNNNKADSTTTTTTVTVLLVLKVLIVLFLVQNYCATMRVFVVALSR